MTALDVFLGGEKCVCIRQRFFGCAEKNDFLPVEISPIMPHNGKCDKKSQ